MLDPDIPKRLPQHPAASALEIQPTEKEIATTIKAMVNAKAVGLDGLPAELLKFGLQQDRTILLELHRLNTLVWREVKVPSQQWKDVVITVPHKKCDKTEYGNYRSISLVSHAGKVLFKVIDRRLSAYCEANGLLLEKQCGFRTDRSTIDMMLVVRRLQEIGRKAGVSLFMCFIDLQKAYDTVDRTLLLQVLTRIGVPPQVIAVIRQFLDGMRACVRPGDGVCLDWFEVGARTTARMRVIPAVVEHLLHSRAERYPPKIQRRSGHPRRAGIPEGALGVDGTGAGSGLRPSCGVGHARRG